MCKAFSCIVTKDTVYWKAGVDSHDQLISDNKLKDDTTDGDLIKFAKIEITPDGGYLHPEGKWTFKVDENTTPRWLRERHKKMCWDALGKWKADVYGRVNLVAAINPVNPLKLDAPLVTPKTILLVKEWDSVGDSVWTSVWASVGASVGASVWASVGDSVRASVGDSVWTSVWASVWASVGASVGDSVRAYTGSLFTIPEWASGYPYQPAVDLWKMGFVPSFDGEIWRLHTGEKAAIVWQMTVKELRAYNG